MNTIILYRKSEMDEAEIEALGELFPSTYMRTAIPLNTFVIGRYSVLPFYRELEQDLSVTGSLLVNSFAQHQFVADIGQWSEQLYGFTPKTWVQGNFGELPEGKAFVLKGQTNSKKFLWNTHMFAKNKADVRNVLGHLLDDSLISTQTIYAREYIPLITYTTALNGLPVTKEFRFFVLYGEVLCGGFYWSNHIEEVEEKNGCVPSVNQVPQQFLQHVTELIGDNIPFYSVDVAQAQNGEWLVIDVNDGQMSGLSEIHPRALYLAMRNVLHKYKML